MGAEFKCPGQESGCFIKNIHRHIFNIRIYVK